jgi:hypothetical protein
MNEKELVKEVLAAELARRTLDRDRRRVQVLTAFTMFLWLAVLILGALLFDVFWRAVPHLKEGVTYEWRTSPVPDSRIQFVDGGIAKQIAALDKGFAVMTTCIVLIGLAALSTILLILLSRRTTLRHVDAGLADIAEQLKQLRDSGSKA